MPDLSVRMLANAPMFRRVPPADRERLIAAGSWTEYAPRERILAEGDPSDFFVIIVTGRAKVFKRTPDGREVILHVFGPGEPIGAAAVFDARPFPASVAALEPTTCLRIPRPTLFALLEAHPSLARGLLGSLSLRLVELTSRLAEHSTIRIEVRLARLFLRLAEQLGRPVADGVLVPLRLSRQELADFTGTTIETAIRIMSRWNREQVLRTDPDGFVLVDRAPLEALAGQ